MKQLPWIWVTERTDVPKWLATDIGRVAVEWSYLEFQTQEIIRLLLATNVKFGRIIATGMNLRTRLLNAKNLLQAYVYDGKLGRDLLTELERVSAFISDEIEGERNELVHSTWARVEGNWIRIRAVKGARGHSQLEKKFKLARSVLPQLEPWTHGKTEAVRAKIATARNDLNAFADQLESALPPSPHKSPRHTRQNRPSRARKTKAPTGQP